VHQATTRTGYDHDDSILRDISVEGRLYRYADCRDPQQEGFRSARRDRVLPKTILKIRNQHHWVSRYHQHRLADKIDGMWTIHACRAIWAWSENGFTIGFALARCGSRM